MDDSFEMPDMENIFSQMQDAMQEAENALSDLPASMGQMDEVLQGFSNLMGNLPAQMEDLSTSMQGFGAQNALNMEALIGKPDWKMQVEITVGTVIHLMAEAEFDLEQLKTIWQGMQRDDFESVVGGVIQANAEETYEPDMMEQIMAQLKKGRGIAAVRALDVLSCTITGAPGNAAASLQLSPEANIPLEIHENGIGVEFAPMLTIRNQWENAAIPTFSPTAGEIILSLDLFNSGSPFSLQFEPAGQEVELKVVLTCSKLQG